MAKFHLRCTVSVPAVAYITVTAPNLEAAKEKAQERWSNGEISSFEPSWSDSDGFDARPT